MYHPFKLDYASSNLARCTKLSFQSDFFMYDYIMNQPELSELFRPDNTQLKIKCHVNNRKETYWLLVDEHVWKNASDYFQNAK